jgi:two-component system OmpR family sensor kinase
VRSRPWRRLRTALLANASLRVRVMAVAAFLVMITSVVMGSLGTTLLHGYLLGRGDQQLRDFAAVASRNLAGGPPRLPQGRQPGQPSRPSQPLQFLIEIIAADGRISVTEAPLHHGSLPRVASSRLKDPQGPFTAPAAGDPGHSWRVLVRTLPGGRHAVVAFSLDNLNSTVTRLEIADAVAGAVAIVLLAGIGLPLVRISLAPLARIEKTAAAIAAGDLSRRIDHPSRRTEVGRLAGALNTMLARIEAAYRSREEGEARALDSEDRMRRFVADASHELRTPLTSVRGLAEFSLQQGTDASHAELIRLMALIQQEAARMGRLVDDLLLLAQFDQDRPLERRPVDLSSIAVRAVVGARLIQPDRPITLHADAPVVVDGDAERLRQVLDNLIGNALQHTPRGTAVTVSVAQQAGQAQLTVRDSGPGLAADQASQVFERFYRTDRARTRARGGTGLGLSIAAALTAAHAGTITVDTQPGRGAAFQVRLPLAAVAGETATDTGTDTGSDTASETSSRR